MPFQPMPPLPALTLQRATPAAGFALQNGTPVIFTWTPPNDGQAHAVLIGANLDVTVAETGGGVVLTCNLPDGSAGNPPVFSGGAGVGTFSFSQFRMVQAGQPVTLQQSSALTLGAAVLFAALWGY